MGIRNVSKSSKARNRRIIKLAPMTRAVRSALAVSALTLGIGLSGNASAASHRLPAAMVHTLQTERPAIDLAPVFDLTTVEQALIAPAAPVQPVIGDGSAALTTGISFGSTTIGFGWTASADVYSATDDVHAMHLANNYYLLPSTSRGNMTARSAAGEAVGIYISTPGRVDSLTNFGAIIADGYTDAAGIAVFAGEDLAVVNNGTIDVDAYLGNAYGILGASGAGDVGISNVNGISAYSHDGMAIGIYAYSAAGNAAVDNSATIDASSYNGLADGIFASGASVDVSNSGGITAEGGTWATGIEARGNEASTVYNSGAISAEVTGWGNDGYAAYAAYGIYAGSATGDASVTNSGPIVAGGYYATGIRTQTYGDASITNAGGITAGSPTGSALAWGIRAVATGEAAAIDIDNTGAITAAGIYGATGIEAVSGGFGGTASVTNTGDITVTQNLGITSYGGTGILASADGDSTIYNDDGTVAVASKGPASGLLSTSFAGTAGITNTGDVSAISTLNSSGNPSVGAIGIVAFSGVGDASVDNSGTVYARGVRSGTGIYAGAGADGNVSVTNSGDIVALTAIASNARADGIKVGAGGGDIEVENSGSIYASGALLAFGVYSSSATGNTHIDNVDGGEIAFYSYVGRGFGMFAFAEQGDVSIDNAGEISGYAWQQAYGARVRDLYGDATISNSGNIAVQSGNNKAFGLLVSATYAGSADITNSGDINVVSRTGSYGMRAYGYAGTNLGNSGTIYADSTNGVAVGMMGQAGTGDTTITNTGGSIEVKAASLALGVYAFAGDGDVAVSNASEIDVLGNGSATAIKAVTSGDVDISNSAYIHAISNGNAFGLYGYSDAGNVSVDNTGDMVVGSVSGLADGIFAGGLNVDVTNAGDITVSGGTWATGIEAEGMYDTVVQNDGVILATATTADGHANGIYATGNASVTIGNTGGLSVYGTYATGIEAQSQGNIAIDNSGNILAQDDGYGVATAIHAISGGEGAAVGITNTGDIAVQSYYGSSGIVAVSGGLGGTASVNNEGDIEITQGNKYGFAAYGIVSSADGDASIVNGGSITATSDSPVTGLAALSFAGDASVTNAGDIAVHSEAVAYYAANGIVSFAGNGSASASSTGNIDVSTKYIGTGMDVNGLEGATASSSGDISVDAWSAYGIHAQSGNGDVSVVNEGSIYATYSGTLFTGTAFGVLATSTNGNVSVDNSGEIGTHTQDQSVGIFGRSGDGDVNITSSGAISAYSTDGYAVGVFARADEGAVSVDSSAAIDAYSYNGYAFGVLARGDTVAVTSSADISAEGLYEAVGIAASSYNGTTVTTTAGAISASAMGAATGIDAQSGGGSVSVTNASDITAAGMVSGARGILAASGADVTVDNTGDISVASMDGDATGIFGYSGDGDTSITNSGAVAVESYNGSAIGIYGYSLNADVTIDNTGDIGAMSYYGLADGIFASGQDVTVTNSGAITVASVYGNWAAGIEAQGSNSTQLDNTGDITASAMPFLQVEDGTSVLYSAGGGKAFGIYATAGGGNGVITNSGNLTVQGGYATGIEAQSEGNLSVTNHGDILAGTGLGSYYNSNNGYGYYYGTQVATGINASGNGEAMQVAVTNTGAIAADGIFGASGISATASGAGGMAVVTNTGDISAAQYVAGGYGAFGIVASADGDSGIDNGGAITVTSGGTGYGVAALSFAGDAMVVNSGDVSVEASTLGSKYYGSYGLLAFAGNGYAAVNNSGTVSVSNAGTMAAPARAVDAQGQQGVGVVNSGSLYADGKYAYGVFAVSTGGDVAVNNTVDGDIGFYSYLGYGTGILGVSEAGDVAIGNAGLISGYGYSQAVGAFGSASVGDVNISNASTGSIDVVSAGAAVGIFARADEGTATVVNSGDISASVFPDTAYVGDVAYGILATSEYGYAAAGNNGDIHADGYYTATGIAARSLLGSTVSTAAGSHINATATYVAIGMEGRAEGGDVTVGSAGDITTAGGDGSVGIQGYSAAGDVTVGNTGHIDAASAYGQAIGATAYTMEGDVAVSNGGLIEAAGGMGSYAVLAQSYLGDVVVNNASGGRIEAAGGIEAIGILANAVDGDATVNNAGVVHAGDAYYATGVLFEGLLGSNTLNNMATGVISADGDDGYAFAVYGGDGVETLNNSGRILGAVTLHGGDDVFSNKAGGIWDVGSTLSTDFGDGSDTLANAAGGTITLDEGLVAFGAGDDTVNNAGLINLTNSTITMGDSQPAPLLQALQLAAENNAFNNSGTLKVVGNSTIDTAGGVFTNTGVINFGNGVTTDALTLGGTLAGSGNIAVDVDFDDHSADQLLIDGDVAGNAVQTVNVNFTGVPTLAAMETKVGIVNVTGTSVAGNFVAGQVVGYNWNGNFLSLGAGIVSTIDASNATDDVFAIGITVQGLSDGGTLAATAASGAAGFLNSQVGTFRQRLGVNPYGDAGKVLSAFVRLYSDQGDVNPDHVAGNFGQGGNFAFEQTSWGREVGVNANLFGNFHAGVVLGNADSRQRLTDGVGENRMNGTTFGAYATWYVPEGLYVDLSGRWMGADIRSNSVGANLQSRARSSAVSLEAGYEWKLGGVNVIPQAQYIRTRVEDVRTFYGENLDFTVDGGTFERGRVGVEVNRTFQTGDIRWTPYGSISAIRDSGGKTGYTVGDFYGATGVSGSRTAAELGLGVQKGGLGLTLGVNWLDGGSLKSFVGGQANLRYSW